MEAGGGALSVLASGGGGGVVISALPAGLLARLPNLIRIDFSGRDEGTRAACTPVLVASLGPLSTALLTGSLRDVAFRGTQVRDKGAQAGGLHPRPGGEPGPACHRPLGG